MNKQSLLLNFSALLSGSIFGLGLILAGMANPAKVLGFLDIAGLWDPSLAFVMLGAIAIGLFAFSWANKHPLSILKQSIQLPNTQLIDYQLVLGSMLFGIGWGLVGVCPGPALVLLGTGNQSGMIFMLAMIAGMGIFELFKKP